MEHPVPLLSKAAFAFLFCCSFLACDTKEAQLPVLNSDDIVLKNDNGTEMQVGKPFSGILYTLYQNSNDTAGIVSYKNGREDGAWRHFYRNGRLKEQRYFSNGCKIGDYTVWWENGKIKLSCHFKNGEYNGSYKEWNEAGVLVIDKNYKNGYEYGTQKQFYDNGKVRSNYIIMGNRRYGLLGTKNCVNVSDSVFEK